MISSLYFLFLGTFGWGISLSLIKFLLLTIDPLEIILYRMMIGSFTLVLILLFLRIPITNIKRGVLDGLVLGTFNIAIPYYLTTLAEREVPSSLVSILNALTPLFTLLIGVYCFPRKKTINYFIIISVFFGLIGSFLVQTEFYINGQSRLGFFYTISACLSYAVAANYMSVNQKNHPIVTATIAAFFSVILLLAYKLFFQQITHWSFPHSIFQNMALVWLGMIGSGISLYIYCYLLKQKGAVVASSITYLITATSVMVGILLLHEQFSIYSLIGLTLIFISLISMHITKRS